MLSRRSSSRYSAIPKIASNLHVPTIPITILTSLLTSRCSAIPTFPMTLHIATIPITILPPLLTSRFSALPTFPMPLNIATIPITMLASTHLSLLSHPDDPNDPAYHDNPHHHASLYSSLAAQRSRRSQRPCRSRRSSSRCPPCYSSRTKIKYRFPTKTRDFQISRNPLEASFRLRKKHPKLLHLA